MKSDPNPVVQTFPERVRLKKEKKEKQWVNNVLFGVGETETNA